MLVVVRYALRLSGLLFDLNLLCGIEFVPCFLRSGRGRLKASSWPFSIPILRILSTSALGAPVLSLSLPTAAPLPAPKIDLDYYPPPYPYLS